MDPLAALSQILQLPGFQQLERAFCECVDAAHNPWDTTLPAAVEATTCEFEIEHTAAVLLAEVEAYE